MTKQSYELPTIGSRHQNNKGLWYTVRDVRGCKQIDVEFDLKGYKTTTTALYVRTGVIKVPSIFVGEVYKDRNGNNITVRSFSVVSNITVEWEDGTTRECNVNRILTGNVLHPRDSQLLTPSISIGDVFTTLQGCEVVVIKYESFKKITVEFSKPFKFTSVVGGGNLLKGHVHNHYIPTVCGVGIIGDVKCDWRGKMYRSWYQMLHRVYEPKNTQEITNYSDCSVEEDWHHLSNFEKWFSEQVVQHDWHLDKDLLFKGNRIYSSDKSIFIPREINTFLTDRAKHRGEWPVGVTYHERILKWQASCSCGGHKNSEYLGVFTSPELAFAAYKTRKEAYAKELADKWQSQIDPRAYEALMSYQVEITD